VRRQVEVLAASGYSGCYTFEWEKVWHPDLEEPEIAIADFAQFMKQIGVTEPGWPSPVVQDRRAGAQIPGDTSAAWSRGARACTKPSATR
jgi:hypothetical protein